MKLLTLLMMWETMRSPHEVSHYKQAASHHLSGSGSLVSCRGHRQTFHLFTQICLFSMRFHEVRPHFFLTPRNRVKEVLNKTSLLLKGIQLNTVSFPCYIRIFVELA